MFGSPGQRALEDRLAALIAGRSVLADQVANLDTPGYRAQDASGFATQLAATVRAQLGDPSQSDGSMAPIAPVPIASVADTSPATPSADLLPLTAVSGATGVVTPDGNGVDLDTVMANLGKTDLDYQAVSRQLQLTYQNLHDAIDSGGA